MADPAGQEAEASLLSEAAAPTALELASDVQRLALARGITVATAESCTGGLVGHSITAHAGSSGYYRGGIVSYADDVKVGPLGVPATTLEHHGAVSAQVAVAMAEGVRGLVSCDYGVAVTGVAGPDGGSDAKPVGLAYVAVAGPAGHEVRRHLWDGDRSQNKEHSAAAALTLLVDVIAGTADSA